MRQIRIKKFEATIPGRICGKITLEVNGMIRDLPCYTERRGPDSGAPGPWKVAFEGTDFSEEERIQILREVNQLFPWIMNSED